MQARPRNLPRRQATPAKLLPGYVRPSQVARQRPATVTVIRKSNKRRQVVRNTNPVPRRHYSERTVHIMHEAGVLRSFERPEGDVFANNCVSETRSRICGEIHNRLKWRASRKCSVNMWITKPIFANLIFRKCGEDHFRWTITKTKHKRGVVTPSKTIVRIALSSREFINIFGFGSDVKRDTDENKRMYVAKIFNEEDDVVRISYCLTSGSLRIRFGFKFFQLCIDSVTGLMDYLEM